MSLLDRRQTATHTSLSLLTVVVDFARRILVFEIICVWDAKQPYPNQGHPIGSFRRSRLPSRGKPLFTFLCCLVFTKLLGLAVAKNIGGSPVIGIAPSINESSIRWQYSESLKAELRHLAMVNH